MNEIDDLTAILAEDYDALIEVGDTCEGFETVAEIRGETERWYTIWHQITRGPSGQHYRWEHQVGSTESQESYGPAELGGGQHAVELTLVRPVEEIITVTKWVKDV
jgi:hypothetical protein